jgi:hypothetical protein
MGQLTMQTQRISRRAVTRGIAWSVPVVAVSVAVPAYAASVPTPLAAATTGSCKCPGGNAPYIFKVEVSFSTTGSDNWSINVASILFDGNAPSGFTPNSATLPGGEGTVLFVLQNPTNNSSSTHDVVLTYSATNTTMSQTTGPIVATLLAVPFTPCKGDLAC